MLLSTESPCQNLAVVAAAVLDCRVVDHITTVVSAVVMDPIITLNSSIALNLIAAVNLAAALDFAANVNMRVTVRRRIPHFLVECRGNRLRSQQEKIFHEIKQSYTIVVQLLTFAH